MSVRPPSVRRLRRSSLALAFAALAAVAAGAFADEIVTKSGTKYQGRIVSEDATHVVIDTPDLGTLRIARSDIATLTGGASGKAPEAPGASSKEPSKDGAKPSAKDPAAKDPAAKDGAKPAAQGTKDPAAPSKNDAAAIAKRKAEEEAKRKADEEALDAAQRMARRKAATIKRRTSPGAETATEAPVRTAEDEKRDREREAMGGADLAKMPPGSQIVLIEPPRPFAAAPGAVLLGRRTWARFDQAGTASAALTVTSGGREERIVVRLADVQRAVAARTEGSHVRLLEGIEDGDWLRLRLDDGTSVSGRFVETTSATVSLRVPSETAAPAPASVEIARVVQVDGLRASSGVHRALTDMESGEPVAVVAWPEGRELQARFVDRMEHHLRLDADGDGEPETLVASDSAIAEIRRIPPTVRRTVLSAKPGSLLKVKGFEAYPDARVERSFVAPVAAVTAYALSVVVEDGCAVIPFDSLVSCEPGSDAEGHAAKRRIEASEVHLPVLPGAPAESILGKEFPRGLSVLTDGRVVTHVYVAPPFDRPICGVTVGDRADRSLPYSDLFFGTEVTPVGDDAESRSREYVTESIEGLRVTAYVDARGNLQTLEITGR